jgi:hypothetical protein
VVALRHLCALGCVVTLVNKLSTRLLHPAPERLFAFFTWMWSRSFALAQGILRKKSECQFSSAREGRKRTTSTCLAATSVTTLEWLTFPADRPLAGLHGFVLPVPASHTSSIHPYTHPYIEYSPARRGGEAHYRRIESCRGSGGERCANSRRFKK